MILAAETVIHHPSLPAVPTQGAKDALAPLLGSPVLYVGLVMFALLALYLSPKTRRVTKLVALGIMALLVVGWDSQQGVLTAAFGSKSNADTGLLVAVVVGGLWAVFRGPSGRTVPVGGGQQGPRRSLFGRGRRGR